MTRKLLALSLVVLAAVPAAALAYNASPDARASASKQCATLQAKLGRASFGLVYASTAACVSELLPVERQNASTAASSCRSEQANARFAVTHAGRTFARFYGTAHTPRNAYGNCVSTKERIASATQVTAAVSAASACQSERSDASFASNHGGKTFAQLYGTDAFASCVSLKLQPPLAVTPLQPATQQPQPSTSTRVGECSGPPEAGGGPAHPLVASCTVAMTN